jgi:hypothetical protein
MKNFILNNKLALGIAIIVVTIFIYAINNGIKLCDCTSTEKEGGSGRSSAHGFYYHK